MNTTAEGNRSCHSPLYNDYRAYLENEVQLAPATREVYLREAGFLLSYLDERGKDVALISLSELDEYFRCRDRGLDARTISRIDSSLRSFFSFLVKENLREDNIALLLEKPKTDQYLPHALSLDEVNSILDSMKALASDDMLFFRDYVFFELIYSCGLRISEAVNLKVSSYSRDEKTLIVFGKRSKERIVFVGEIAAGALDEYLSSVRPVLAGANRKKARRTLRERESTDALFLGRRGEKLTRQAMHKRYHALVGKLGIDATVHALRHSYATHLLRGGANIRQVQMLLGHADIKTTQIYTHLNTDDLLATFDKYFPLSSEKQS